MSIPGYRVISFLVSFSHNTCITNDRQTGDTSYWRLELNGRPKNKFLLKPLWRLVRVPCSYTGRATLH